MSPDLSDPQLLALLAEGLSQREIARRMGIPRTTLQDRIKRLGLQVTPASPTPQGPPASRGPRVSPSTPAPPAVTFVAVPEMQELLRLVKDLHARVEVIEQTRVPPALPAAPTAPATPTPPVTPTAPAPPVAERKDVQQWTIRLSKGLIDHLKAVAYERRVPPSQLIEEWLWQQARRDR